MTHKKQSLLHTFVEQMPKVELHIHLEGSIPYQTLAACAKKNNRPVPPPVPSAAKSFSKNFQEFVELYLARIRCLATPEDYEHIVCEFGKYCATQNIRYTETTFTLATNSLLSGLPWQVIMAAIENGRKRVEKEYNVTIRWIFDIVRDEAERQKPVLEAVLKDFYPDSIAAVGLSGYEKIEVVSLVPFFEDLNKRNIPTSIHAGELEGEDSIWFAIDKLKAKRIGHAIAMGNDTHLIEEFKLRKIPIECCPTSNIRMGGIASYKEHPLRIWWKKGLLVTLNSDDPELFHTTLSDEYKVLIDEMNFTVDEIVQMSMNGIKGAFLPPEEKDRLLCLYSHVARDLRRDLFPGE